MNHSEALELFKQIDGKISCKASFGDVAKFIKLVKYVNQFKKVKLSTSKCQFRSTMNEIKFFLEKVND
jgi:hypothetical protein